VRVASAMSGSTASMARLESQASAMSVGSSHAVEVSPELEPLPTARQWYYLDATHEQQGPVTWADLQSMEHSGHIDGNSYVFTEGMPDWQLASEINWRGSEPSA